MATKQIQFFYPYNDPSFEDFQYRTQTLSRGYEADMSQTKLKRDNLLEKYDKHAVMDLIATHGSILDVLMSKIVQIYMPIIQDKPFGIYWSGSFARNSNRLLSDFDLNFSYPDNLRDQLLPVEEQICYMLTKVVGRPRDLAHSPLASNLDANSFQEEKLSFRMNWPNNYEEYDISQGLENLMLKGHNASRAEDIFKRYLLGNISPSSCKGWTASYKIIYGNKILQPVFDDIYAEEKDRFRTPEFMDGFSTLIQDRKNIIRDLLNRQPDVDINKIRHIKEHYKKQPIDQIFATLDILRRKVIMEGKDIGNIKVDDYSRNKDISCLIGPELSIEFFDRTYEYLWNIIRLEAIFEKQGLRFGMHSTQSIDDSFNRTYVTVCPDINDLHLYHDNQLKQIYSTIDSVLNNLK
jgi:hypothetical protein